MSRLPFVLHQFFVVIAIFAVVIAHAAPPPGHPSVDQASSILGVPEQSLVNHGEVLEAFNSNDYTYMRLSHPVDNERWLAAPRQDLAVGTKVSYGDGMRMENFYSKVWHRTFPVIYFVSGVLVEQVK